MTVSGAWVASFHRLITECPASFARMVQNTSPFALPTTAPTPEVVAAGELSTIDTFLLARSRRATSVYS